MFGLQAVGTPPRPLWPALRGQAINSKTDLSKTALAFRWGKGKGFLLMKPLLPFFHFATTVFCLAWLSTAQSAHASIKAGANVTDITPPAVQFPISVTGSLVDRSVEKTDEKIHCRTIALASGGTTVTFTLVDSCVILREVMDAAKHLAAEQTGIPVENMTIAATHSHSAPTVTPIFQSSPSVAYQIFLPRKIAESIAAAYAKMEPAEAGWAVGKDPAQVFNRRWLANEPYQNPFGEMDTVRMNPGYNKGGGKVSKPAAPVDPDVSVLAIRSAGKNKRPIALLANYSLHYVGNVPLNSAGKPQLSGDYFARFADVMKEKIAAGNGDFVAIMSNGTSGDINNVNYGGPPPEKPAQPGGQMMAVARSVGDAAFKAYQTVQYQADLPIFVAARELQLGVRKADEAGLKRAHEILSSPQKLVNGDFTAYDAVYARETLHLREYPDTVPVRLQSIRIGDLCINTTPTETFVEIGLELKQASPFEASFTIELANGYNGYLPTPQQHE